MKNYPDGFAPVQRLPRNTRGRDYLVADIHGCFNLLADALARVQFRPEVDRLFVAGDLIDRGPRSTDVLAFLAQPWVYAIRGNHEQMLLDCYEYGELDTERLSFNVKRNGMAWWLTVPDSDKPLILAAISLLPFAIEVETALGLVGIVHAEVPASLSWQQFMVRLEANDPAAQLHALWSRSRENSGDTSGVAGIDRLFTGHTPQPDGPRQLGNWIICDTGAVFGFTRFEGLEHCQLTLVDLTVDTATLNQRQPGLVAVYATQATEAL